ncbi:hypothetical protein Tco_1530826 [Tanacetum coccineum]
MAAISNVPQLVDKKGGSYFVVAPRLEPENFNKWKKRMLCYLMGMELYYIQCIKDSPFKPKIADGLSEKHELRMSILKVAQERERVAKELQRVAEERKRAAEQQVKGLEEHVKDIVNMLKTQNPPPSPPPSYHHLPLQIRFHKHQRMEQNLTQLCNIDPMLDDLKVLARCISIWKAHPAGNPTDIWSLDIVLQDPHHTLRYKCRHGKETHFVSPFDCGDCVVRLVLYDLTKPQNPASSIQFDRVEDLVLDEHDGFTLPLFDSLFSKGLRTIKFISRKCCLSLLVLAFCLFKTFFPRSNLECKEVLDEASLSWSSIDEENLNLGEPNVKQYERNICDDHYTAELLGKSATVDFDFSIKLVMKRVAKTIKLMDAVDEINDPQCELLLLRAYAGISKLYFAMCTCSPRVFEWAQYSFDVALMPALERIVNASRPRFGD